MRKFIPLIPVFILALSVSASGSASAKTTERNLEINLSTVPVALTVKSFEQPKSVHQLLAEATQKVEEHADEVQEKKEAVETAKIETTKAVESKQSLSDEIAALKAEIEASKQAIADKAARDAEAARVAAQRPVVQAAPALTRPSGAVVAGNTYTPGQCTYYVKNMRPDIPNNWGNANTWVYNARLAGYATGSTPAVGAIAASNYEMHVAYVIGVSGNMVTISEMNYGGPWIMNTRTVPAHLFTYIY